MGFVILIFIIVAPLIIFSKANESLVPNPVVSTEAQLYLASPSERVLLWENKQVLNSTEIDQDVTKAKDDDHTTQQVRFAAESQQLWQVTPPVISRLREHLHHLR